MTVLYTPVSYCFLCFYSNLQNLDFFRPISGKKKKTFFQCFQAFYDVTLFSDFLHEILFYYYIIFWTEYHYTNINSMIVNAVWLTWGHMLGQPPLTTRRPSMQRRVAELWLDHHCSTQTNGRSHAQRIYLLSWFHGSGPGRSCFPPGWLVCVAGTP